MRYLIFIFLVVLNPILFQETSKSTAVKYEPELLSAPEDLPRLIDNSTTISWIKSHQKEDGGYGRLDSFWSHGSWTYAAVHALTLLNKTRTDRLALPENAYDTMIYVQSQIRGTGYSVTENINTLNLLGYEPFNKQSIIQEYTQTNLPDTEPSAQYTRIEEIFYNVGALKLLGAADRAYLGDIMQLINLLNARQNPDGGWDNIGQDDDRFNLDGTSYVTYTWYAAITLSNLNVPIPNNESLIKFIQSCQNPDGGFGNRPDGLGSSSDVYYTFAAIQLLDIFEEKPVDVNEAINWLNRLQNYDGGFGDKPQWNSRLYSTYYAIHSLIMLNGAIFEKIREPPKSEPIPATHQVFSFGMQVQYVDLFSSESVLIADDLGLDLIGLKTKNVLASARANEFAEYYNLSTRTVLTPELYHDRIDVKGLGRFDHVSEPIYPLDGNPGPVKRFEWQEFKNAIRQGHEGDALFFIGPHTKDFDYLIIDDSLESLNGFDLIWSGSYPEDVVRQYPWYERWIGKIPMVMNIDAHREFWELQKQFETQRTLFIAPNSTWKGFKDAVLNNRVVVAFKTENTPGFDDVVLYGTTEATSFLKDHGNEWIWWRSPHSILEVLITPITHSSSILPDNSYEWDLGNFTGTILRIKTAPTTRIISFKLDEQQLLYNLTFVDRTSSYSLTSFYYVQLERISNGTHVAEVEYVSQDGLRFVKTLIFDTGYPSLYLRELTHFPAEPTNRDSIIAKVTVIENVPAKQVILWYSIDGNVTWNTISMSKGENTDYSIVIGKMPPDSTVYYYVEAIDMVGNFIRLPQNRMDYASFEISYQRSPEEYTYIFTLSVIPIVSIMSLLSEIHWSRKSRKHS